MLRKMPFILLVFILILVLAESLMPLTIKEFLYSVSMSIKSGIVLILPAIIFSLLFKTIVLLSKQATRIISLIFVLVCCSNFISTSISHFIGMWIYNFDLNLIAPDKSNELICLWSFNPGSIITNDKAMFAGIILGLLASYLKPIAAVRIANRIDIIVTKILNAIVYLIPIFIAGFIVKLQHDKTINIIFHDYAIVFAIVAASVSIYVSLCYLVLSNFKLSTFVTSIKNMLPAAVSGFCTMSSAASMPLTILGAQNNSKNNDLARSVIPATVNIHLVGDCFAIPIFAFAIMKSFGLPMPSLYEYFIFSLYFVVAKFSVAAIPGGGILVMLPILENNLNLNTEMLSIITALYILFDPVITCTNILGNGIFSKMIDRIYREPQVMEYNAAN